MKKILKTITVLIILCMLVLTLSGCGKKKEEKNIEIENKLNVIETPDQEHTQENILTTEETSNDENDDKENEKKSVEGKWKENQYINEFAKIKFNMPSNWTKYSKKDMEQLITSVTSKAVDEEQKKKIESAMDTSVYDMLVGDTTTGANINIVLIEQTENQNPELYMKELKKQFESIKEISYKTDEPATVKIAGEEYTCLKTTAEISGIKLEQAYYVKTKDNYMITIIITTTQEGQLNKILSYFE